RCLIVDADIDWASGVGGAFERLGATTTIVVTRDAVGQLLVGPWDIVLAELRHGDGAGQTFCRRANAVTIVTSDAFDAERPRHLRETGNIPLDRNLSTELVARIASIAWFIARNPDEPLAGRLREVLPRRTRVEWAVESFALKHRLSPTQTRML